MKIKGFTLIEILVVIAIIAVLVAILFPVLASAKESANKIVCASNMKQLATAELEYGADNNGNYDARAMGIGLPAYTLAIGPYCKDVYNLVCPDNVPGNPDPGRHDLRYTGYVLNGCLPKASAVIECSKLVMFAEEASFRWVYPNFVTSPSQPQSYLEAPDYLYRLPAYQVVGKYGSMRHFGKGNYAMADGHVELVAPTEVQYIAQGGCDLKKGYSVKGSPNSISFPNLP